MWTQSFGRLLSDAMFRHRPPKVRELIRSLESGQSIYSTGLVLQELQGFSGPRSRVQILERFSSLPLITPDRNDHMGAADLRNKCRRAGVQVQTNDALLAQLCIRNDLVMLTTDGDFEAIGKHSQLKTWQA